MQATSAIVEQLIDGPRFVLIPNLIDASEASEARSRALEIAASPFASSFGSRNEKNGQHHIRGLLANGEIFERMVQHPAIIEIAEAMLGDDMTLGAYFSAELFIPVRSRWGFTSTTRIGRCGGRSPVRPPMMVQVIWMLQDFTERNGATLVAPRSQLRCAPAESRAVCARGNQDNRRARRRDHFARAAVAQPTQNHTEQPRVALLMDYGLKVIRPLDSEIAKVPPAVLNVRRPSCASCWVSSSSTRSRAISRAAGCTEKDSAAPRPVC